MYTCKPLPKNDILEVIALRNKARYTLQLRGMRCGTFIPFWVKLINKNKNKVEVSIKKKRP